MVDQASRARRQRRYAYVSVLAFVCLVATVVSLFAISESRAKAEESLAKASAQEEAIRARNTTRMAVARENQADPTLTFALVREMEPAYQPPRWRDLARWARQNMLRK